MKVSLKKMLYLMSIMLLAGMVMVSCKKDDDDDDPKPPVVEDGIYIKGAGTALTDFNLKGLMLPTKNEVGQEARASLLELYVAVKGGSDGFNIVKVAGTAQTTYGPGADFALVTEDAWDLNNEYPKTAKYWRGSIAETDAKFTVPDDGLYQIVYDTELGVVVITEAKWGMIGAATPGGWGEDTPMNTTFNLEKMDFTVTGLTLLENAWKFRMGGGWKIWLNEEGTVKINTNLGGDPTAPEPGGADIMHDNYGVYTVTLTWELGKAFVGKMERTGDGEPLPEYPEAVYLVGDGTAYGWDAPGTSEEAIFHKTAGGAPSEGIFWKIAHLEGGLGFKISAAAWSEPNLGFGQVQEFDAEGIQVVDNGGNMSIAASESGMYVIVLNLRDDMVKVSVKPAEVYGIGDAFGGWDQDIEANKFVVDNVNKTLVSPPLVANGNIRMYAQHNWIPDWWNAEFNLFDGKILYRNDGGDQDAVAGTAGQVVTLTFDNNTGTIQ